MLAGCGGRDTTGGADLGPLTDADAWASVETGLELPWNPWDFGKTDLAKYDGVQPGKTAVAEIQGSQTSTDCTEEGFNNVMDDVQLEDVVVVAPKYKASGSLDGYFVAKAGLTQSTQWNGIAITIDNAQGTDFQVGTTLSMTVDYLEYFCLSELEVKAYQDKGAGTVPTPAVIDPAVIGSQDAAQAEPFEGVLVKVEAVEVTEAMVPGSDGKDHGMFQVTGGLIVANDFELTYMNAATDQREVGDKFDAITGIVTYSYGNYVLLPRWDSDMVPEGGLPDTTPDTAEPATDPDTGGAKDVHEVPPEVWDATDDTGNADTPDTTGTEGMTVFEIQTHDESLNCTNEGAIVTILAGVSMADVVVTSPRVFVSGTLHGYYVQDPVETWPVGGFGKYTGMLVAILQSENTNFQAGDLLSIIGDYQEIHCMTDVQASSMTKVGSKDPSAPLEADASAFAGGGDAAEAEPYEGSIVRLQNVTVTDVEGGSSPAWWFKVGNGIFISNNFDLDDEFTPTDGQTLTSITGAVKYSWGKYLIAPRTVDDIVVAD